MKFLFVVGLGMVSTGCFLAPKKMVAVLPQPPQPSLTKPAPVLTIPPSVTPIETPASSPAPPPAPKVAETLPDPPAPAPAEPKKPAPRRTRRNPVASAAVAPEVIPAEPAPELRELLTPERRIQLEGELASSVVRATAALDRASHHKLTAPQGENVSRIQTFLAQAESAKKEDLATALQLARRADLLGQDLLKSLLP